MALEVQAAFDSIVKDWSVDWFLRSLNQIRINLTGQVLNVDLGNLRDSVPLVSRVNKDGFTLGTNVDYGVYWEGTPEGRVNAPGAGFPSAGNKAARAFIRPVLDANEPAMQEDLISRFENQFPAMFPSLAIDIRVFFP